jgi:hypothetical protein
MIKVFDIDKLQYYPFEDYSQSITIDSLLGRLRTVNAIAEHTDGNAKFTAASHGFLTDQTVSIAETTNYDDQYVVTVLNTNTFVCEDCPYVADETSGEAYPLMDGTYYFAFLWTIETIFDRVKHISAIRAKAIKDNQGKSMLEEFAFSEDRRDTFLLFCKEASDKVFAKLSGYASIIQNAYIFNDQIDMDGDGVIGSLETDYMVHMAINLDTTYMDVNKLAMIEQKIIDGIVYDILAQWFRNQGSPEDYTMYNRSSEGAVLGIGHFVGQINGKKGITFKSFF